MLRWAGGEFERPWRVANPGEIPALVERLVVLSSGRSLRVAMEPQLSAAKAAALLENARSTVAVRKGDLAGFAFRFGKITRGRAGRLWELAASDLRKTPLVGTNPLPRARFFSFDGGSFSHHEQQLVRTRVRNCPGFSLPPQNRRHPHRRPLFRAFAHRFHPVALDVCCRTFFKLALGIDSFLSYHQREVQ
jgi:hypothetical protein